MKAKHDLKLLYTLQEAADCLGVSLRTLTNMRYAGELSVHRIGSRVLVHRDDLATLAKARRCKTDLTKPQLVKRVRAAS